MVGEDLFQLVEWNRKKKKNNFNLGVGTEIYLEFGPLEVSFRCERDRRTRVETQVYSSCLRLQVN